MTKQRQYLKEKDSVRGALQRNDSSAEQGTSDTADTNVSVEKKFENAKKRNKRFIKDLELAAARLRTRASYTPSDNILERAKLRYIRNLKSIQPMEK